MAEALYRKYRPQVFEDVVGQEPIERTLKNAISQDKVSHAYLFCGPRGTGKTTTARLLAKALLCETGPTPDPDGTCEDCRLIAEGTHPDVYELDAASRTGVENVREEIISRVSFAPTRGRSKVYIIDEVHMLSTAAFNALLKTLEEPPSHVVFILCTTDPQKVPETIHSRCQRFDFHRISPESMVARLGAICMAEEVDFEGEALDLIAQRAGGGLRDALTSLEQIIAFENGKVTLAGAERLLGSIDSNNLAEIVAYVGKRDIASCFRWTAAFVETGADLAQFVRDMAEHVRNLYILSLVGDEAELDVSETARRQLANELSWFGEDRCARLLGVLGDLMAELKTSSNPRLAFEIALTRMVRPDSDLTIEALAERVEALESGYSAVAHVLPGEVVLPGGGATPGEDAQPGGGAHPDAAFDRESFAPAAIDGPRSEVAQAQPRASVHSGAVGGNAVVAEGAPVPVTAQSAFADSAGDGSALPEQGSPVADSAAAVSQGGPKVSALSNPAALQRIWQATLADVKKQKQAYGVLFMNTKVAFDDAAGTIRVLFPAEATFAFNAVQKPEVQGVLGDALVKAVGATVPFQFEKADEQQSAAPASSRGQSVEIPVRFDARSGATGREAQSSVSREAKRQAPEPERSSQSAPEREAQPDVSREAKRQAPEPERFSHSAPAEDEAPYEPVPYDEVPYDPVPYDEVPYGEFDASVDAVVDARVDAPPEEPRHDEGGAASEDATALQAMLQASFGEGVVLSEADE